MAINLDKGQREKINIPSFKVGLGWDSNASATGEAFDVDASVFLLGSDGKLIRKTIKFKTGLADR